MKKKTTTTKKTSKRSLATKKRETNDDYSLDNLYVCMQDYKNKRKNLLLALKNSLVMQEEHGKLMRIRNDKSFVLKDIKKNVQDINTKYQELKKSLPNVKNVLSYTEKELQELDEQIEMLKKDTRANEELIYTDETLEDSITKENSNLLRSRKKESTENETERQRSYPIRDKKNFPNNINSNTPKKLTEREARLERIKNNLSVVEDKLKDL